MPNDDKELRGRATMRGADPRAAEAGRTDGDRPQDDGHRPLRKRRAWYRRPRNAAIAIGAVIIVAVGGTLLWRHLRRFETTNDAFIDVAPQRVGPQVAGRVARVLVNDNEDVTPDQTLVELDPAEFEHGLELARASRAQAEAQLADAEAQRAVFDAQREQARAGEVVASTRASDTATDLRRAEDIWRAGSGGISRQQLDHARAEANSSAAESQAARKAVTAAEAQLTHASRLIDIARAAIRSATAQVAQAELTRSYVQVKASVAGRVARKTVAEGNYVQPGTDLMAVVPRDVYVTANFKETQLARMRRGQPVEIKVDAYPDLELTGRVDSVQPATGQVFDLLPSQNAAGNWVKVVQRVPVKIVLDRLSNDPARLAPGMSVDVKVTVR